MPTKVKHNAARVIRAARVDPRWQMVRQLVGMVKRLRINLKRGGLRSPTDRLTGEVRRSVGRRDWTGVRAALDRWSPIARENGDHELLERVGNDLRRIGDFSGALAAFAESKLRCGAREWDGKPLGAKRLLVERRGGDLALYLIFISCLPLAASKGLNCVFMVEDRLVPLFRRSFPGLDIRGEKAESFQATADTELSTSFEYLANWLHWDSRQRARLLPDGKLVETLRRRYKDRSSLPLIGLSWGSINRFKKVPGLSEWQRLVSTVPAKYVSLQYGDTARVIHGLRKVRPNGIVEDPEIDQVESLDMLAAQLSSLDAVVTISNTVAHMAGAVGTPTFVLLDGAFKRSWPALQDSVPWYSSVVLRRRTERSWRPLFSEVSDGLRTVIKESNNEEEREY